MKITYKDFIVTVLGALTSFITAMVLSWIEVNYDLSIYSFTFWFVIPLGAITAGFIAASGYYFGSILFNHKPNRIILLNMLVISFGCYFFIQYFNYQCLEIEDQKLSDIINFWQYLDFCISNTAIQFRMTKVAVRAGNPVEIGAFLGYVYAIIQIIGFTIGGLASYLYLSEKSYCKKCSCYFKVKNNNSKYTGDHEAISKFVEQSKTLVKDNDFSGIISNFSLMTGDEKFNKKIHNLKYKLIIKNCPICDEHCLFMEFYEFSKNSDWKKLDQWSFKVFRV